MSLSSAGNISAPDTEPGGRATAEPGRAVQARPTVALVVDDEPKIRDLARRYLEADGFQVLEAADGEAALTVLAETEPDIVVTDIMMPVLNGLELLRQIRLTSAVPVVMLTARDDEIDKVLALTTGADDYVTKPFGGRELAARLRAILRRLQTPHAAPAAGHGEAAEAALTFAGVTIDPGRRSVHTSGGSVTVTALDYDLLLALARNPGLVLSPQAAASRRLGGRGVRGRTSRRLHIRNLATPRSVTTPPTRRSSKSETVHQRPATPSPPRPHLAADLPAKRQIRRNSRTLRSSALSEELARERCTRQQAWKASWRESVRLWCVREMGNSERQRAVAS